MSDDDMEIGSAMPVEMSDDDNAKSSNSLLILALSTLEESRRPKGTIQKLIHVLTRVTTFLKEHRPEEDPAKRAVADGTTDRLDIGKVLALLGGVFALNLESASTGLVRVVIKLFSSAALPLKSQRPNWNLYFLHTITLCQCVQGEPFNELVDTIISRVMPQQPEWSAELCPALLDCILNKAPDMDSNGKGVPGLTRLVDHLRNNTKSFYVHLISIIANGSPAAMQHGVQLVEAQWPQAKNFCSKSGSTLLEYCEENHLFAMLADSVIQMLLSFNVEFNQLGFALLRSLELLNRLTEQNIGKLLMSVSMWLARHSGSNQTYEESVHHDIVFQLQQSLVIPWMNQVDRSFPKLILEILLPYPSHHLRVGPTWQISPVLYDSIEYRWRHYDYFSRIGAKFDVSLTQTLPVWLHYIVSAPRPDGLQFAPITEKMGLSIMKLVELVASKENRFVAFFPVLWLFTRGRMDGLEETPRLLQIYEFALPAMMSTMVACGRLQSGREEQMRDDMRPCGLRLLRLFVELKMQVPFEIYYALLEESSCPSESSDVLTCLHLQVKAHPSPLLYDELKPIFVMLGELGFASCDTAGAAAEAAPKTNSTATNADSTDQDLVDLLELACTLFTVSVGTEDVSLVIGDKLKPYCMLQAHMKPMPSPAKTAPVCKNQTLALRSPMILRLLHMVKSDNIQIARIGVARLYSLFLPQSKVSNKAMFLLDILPYMYSRLWDMISEQFEHELRYVVPLIVYCIAADSKYFHFHTEKFMKDKGDWRKRWMGAEKVTLVLRFCADLGDEFQSLLSDMELFNGVEGTLMMNDLSIAYEKLLMLLTDDEDLVRAKVSSIFSTMPPHHVRHLVKCISAKLDLQVPTQEKICVLVRLARINQLFPSVQTYSWEKLSNEFEPEEAHNRSTDGTIEVLTASGCYVGIDCKCWQMLANNVPIASEQLKILLSKMKLLLMNNEDSLFNSDLIITSYLQGLGWYLQHDLSTKPEEAGQLILKFALDNAHSFLLLPHQQVQSWLLVVFKILTSHSESEDIQLRLKSVLVQMLRLLEVAETSDPTCETTIQCFTALLELNPHLSTQMLPDILGTACRQLLKWKKIGKPNLVSELVVMFHMLFKMFGKTGIFLHVFKEDSQKFLGVSTEDFFLVLRLLLLGKDTTFTLEGPVSDVIKRFFDQPTSSMEKNSILINTTRYIESCFKKDLPEALVEQISNFIPKVIQGLPVGADLDTFSCCYSLARTVLAKGGNRTYFARRRLINLFKKKLEMSGGYFPNQSVVAFARTYLETDSAALPKQLATMFHNLFSTTAPVDQFYIKDAVDTLLEDLKAKQPLVTPRCNSYFDALVQFIGRSDELGVHDVDVMSTMAKYILKQAEFKPELWSHIEGSHVLSKAAGGGLKLQLHHRAAHRLRLLTWMMLALGTKSADGDSSHSDLELGVNPLADEAPVASAFEILPEQIETLVSIALKGLLNIGDGEDVMEMGARDVKTLLLVLNAMKVLLWLHPASVCDIWPRLWEDLHALLFDQTDSVGSTLMFMLYVMQTGSELVSQCKAEWRSVCNAVMASYLPLETKPAKSIKMLVMQVKATFVCTVQRTISRHEIELRLLQDLGSLNAQTEFFTWAD